jgi:hypothetical protein
MLKNRLILLMAFALLSSLVIIGISGQQYGSSGPIMGFCSWAYMLGRLSGNIPSALIIYLAYLLGLFFLTTLMAFLKKDWGLLVPILIHCLGSVIASLTFVGPLLIDEPPSSFLIIFTISIITTILYIVIDWRLAYSGQKR